MFQELAEAETQLQNFTLDGQKRKTAEETQQIMILNLPDSETVQRFRQVLTDLQTSQEQSELNGRFISTPSIALSVSITTTSKMTSNMS